MVLDRTGSSSPLGELFDHGCDSIVMGMMALVLAGAVRLGGVLTLVGLIIGWGPFYLAHWEEYHTGILIMGKFNGPTEAQLIVIGFSLPLTSFLPSLILTHFRHAIIHGHCWAWGVDSSSF
jgi:ethanolaminephosphotransferase